MIVRLAFFLAFLTCLLLAPTAATSVGFYILVALAFWNLVAFFLTFTME